MKELKEGENRVLVNHEDEIKTLTNYIKENWNGHENIKSGKTEQSAINDLVSHVYYQAIKDSASWFDEHEVCFETIGEKEDKRKDFLKNTEFKHVYLYDYFHRTLSNLHYAFSDIDRVFKGYPNWDFSNQVDNLYSNLKNHFKGLNNKELKPINWKNTQPETLKETIINSFEGHNSAGLRSFNFPENLHHSNVSYNENEQGRSKPRTLVAAIYSHALGISENNNTFIIKNTINKFDDIYKETPINGEKIDTSILNSSPITELAMKVLDFKVNEEHILKKEYSHNELVNINKDIKNKKEEWANKSDEEKEILKKERDKDMANEIAKMIENIDNELDKENNDEKSIFIKTEFENILKKEKNKNCRKQNNFKLKS